MASYIRSIDPTSISLHQQDADGFCGAACVDMLLPFVDKNTNLGQKRLRQSRLMQGIGDEQRETAETWEPGSNIFWSSAPYGILFELWEISPATQGYVLKVAQTEDDITRAIIDSLADPANPMPSLALVFGLGHWLLVRGFETDKDPNGAGGAYQPLSIDVYNPWPELPDKQLGLQHGDGDGCGTGYVSGKGVSESRGSFLDNISYDEWRCFYMTGVPNQFPGQRQINSGYTGRFLAIVNDPAAVAGQRLVQAPANAVSGAPPDPPYPASWNGHGPPVMDLTARKAACEAAKNAVQNLMNRAEWAAVLVSTTGLNADPNKVVAVAHEANPGYYYFIVPIETSQGQPVAVRVDAVSYEYLEAIGVAAPEVAVTVHDEGSGVLACSIARHACSGSCPLPAHVLNSVCKRIRVVLPSPLRVPPLILRATASGRIARSARLFVASTPACRTNSNNSPSCRFNRWQSACTGCPRVCAQRNPNLRARCRNSAVVLSRSAALAGGVRSAHATPSRYSVRTAAIHSAIASSRPCAFSKSAKSRSRWLQQR